MRSFTELHLSSLHKDIPELVHIGHNCQKSGRDQNILIFWYQSVLIQYASSIWLQRSLCQEFKEFYGGGLEVPCTKL